MEVFYCSWATVVDTTWENYVTSFYHFGAFLHVCAYYFVIICPYTQISSLTAALILHKLETTKRVNYSTKRVSPS